MVETLVLLPVALRRKEEIGDAWRSRRKEALGVAVLSPLAYVLVLMALSFASVSHVAPTREISILIDTLMGGSLLAEGGLTRRLFASSFMVLGIVALAVG